MQVKRLTLVFVLVVSLNLSLMSSCASPPSSGASSSAPAIETVATGATKSVTPVEAATGPTAATIAALEPTKQTAVPTEARTEEASAPAIILYVGNTDGQGVYVRRSPDGSERVKAWADGTRMAIAGPDRSANGQEWKNVRDPDGNVGFVPAAYLNGSPLAASNAAPKPATTGGDASDAVTRVSASLVLVVVPSGTGSGFQTRQGIVTNAHVVAGVRQVQVRTVDGQTAPANVVRTDSDADLALLSSTLSLPPLDFEPARQQRIGDSILVLGFPRTSVRGATPSLTRGVVSSFVRAGAVEYLQTDAAINPGNSGGPVFTLGGRVVGVATARLREAEGIGIAIPSEAVERFLASSGAAPVSLPPPGSAPQPTAAPRPALDEPRSQAARRIDQYFAALNARDYRTAWTVCCSPNWRRRYPLDAFQANFVGVTDLRYTTPLRYVSVEPDRIVVEADYSFISRETRRFFTLRWTLVPVGGEWLADEATAAPRT